MSKEEIRRCDHDKKIITNVCAARQVRYFKPPWGGSNNRVRVTIEVQNYRGDILDLCKKCQTAVFKRIFTRPVRVPKDAEHQDTGAPAASGTVFPLAETFKEINPRQIYWALLIWAIAGYLGYLAYLSL